MHTTVVRHEAMVSWGTYHYDKLHMDRTYECPPRSQDHVIACPYCCWYKALGTKGGALIAGEDERAAEAAAEAAALGQDPGAAAGNRVGARQPAPRQPQL